MLKIVRNLRELDFGALMDVYEEGNRENGAARYPACPENEQILLARQDFYAYLREDFFPIPGAFYALWEDRGKYVSALRMEPYRDGLLLEALETAPGERQKGYARALISAVQETLPSGTAVYAHVSKSNAASLAVQARCGFVRISEQAAYIDGTVTARACTLRWTAP